MSKSNSPVSKSWFCTFANAKEHGFKGTPEEIVNEFVEIWTSDFPTRSCMIAYCVSAEGFEHIHAVLEDTKSMRYTAIQKAFPGIHVEPTKGSKKDAEDYINKRGKFEESGEKILYQKTHGTIRANRVQKNDYDVIEELLGLGLTPNDIFSLSFRYRKYDKIIRDAFYQKRFEETPVERSVTVFWHVGDSGSGKSYEFVKLCEKHGENEVYMCNEYKAGMDKYNGEKILFADDFRGQWSYTELLTALHGFKTQFHCRYSNVYALWSEVHITSIMPPEEVYKKMVSKWDKDSDPISQLKRRINTIVYHYKNSNNEYCAHAISMNEYTNYDALRLSVPDADITDSREELQPLSKEEQRTIEDVFNTQAKEEKPY